MRVSVLHHCRVINFSFTLTEQEGYYGGLYPPQFAPDFYNSQPPTSDAFLNGNSNMEMAQITHQGK